MSNYKAQTTQKQIKYECIAVDVQNQDCTLWRPIHENQFFDGLFVDFLTIKIIGFMVFVFICREIKRSVMS